MHVGPSVTTPMQLHAKRSAQKQHHFDVEVAFAKQISSESCMTNCFVMHCMSMVPKGLGFVVKI